MIRDCPFCHTKPKEEGDGVILTKEVLLTEDGVEQCDIGYTVRCCQCGGSVNEEYRQEAIARWNGDPMPWEEEEQDPAEATG